MELVYHVLDALSIHFAAVRRRFRETALPAVAFGQCIPDSKASGSPFGSTTIWYRETNSQHDRDLSSCCCCCCVCVCERVFPPPFFPFLHLLLLLLLLLLILFLLLTFLKEGMFHGLQLLLLLLL